MRFRVGDYCLYQGRGGLVINITHDLCAEIQVGCECLVVSMEELAR